MDRLDGGRQDNQDIERNRANISNRLEEMRNSVIPSFWYSLFKSSWLIAIVVALILLFTSGDGKGIFSGGEMSTQRLIAIILIVYGILADLVFAPLAKHLFLKKHPGYQTTPVGAKKRSPKQANKKAAVKVQQAPKKQNKKLSKAQKAKLGTSADK